MLGIMHRQNYDSDVDDDDDDNDCEMDNTEELRK